jgi:acyl carrier protein
VTGELFIAGDQLARGYLGRADLTAERFLEDPFVTSERQRMYKTGDLARWRPDGMLEFLGRNDHQVKIRGFRIELGEIEATLRSVPGIRDAAVIVREIGAEHGRPGEKRLEAYCTGSKPAIGSELDLHAVETYLAQTLPDYMQPTSLVRLDALPLTVNGKVDRKALLALANDKPGADRYEAPQGETETQLAAFWAELLRVERVGRNDHFFDIGGHSLLAVRLMLRIKTAFGVNIEMQDVFSDPTLSAMANRILDAQLSQFDHDELIQLLDEQ